MAPPEAAQERPQGGGRFDRAVENTGRPPGAQRIGVVDAVGHHLVAGVGRAGGTAQVKAAGHQFTQTQAQAQGNRQDQPGVGHQSVVVEGNANAVGGLG